MLFIVKPSVAQPPPPAVITASSFKGTIETCIGLASTSVQQFSISGLNLSSNVIVTAPVGFQISLNLTTGFDTLINLVPKVGVLSSTLIYVRLGTSNLSGTRTGNVSISSDGAITLDVPVNGAVYSFPAIPKITPNGNTKICVGNQAKLISSAKIGNQWYLNGIALKLATDSIYGADTAGNYTLVVTTNGCSTKSIDTAVIALTSLPAKPTISKRNDSLICFGDSIILTSSASNNRWLLNGNNITGAVNDTFIVKSAGSYTVVTTNGQGCSAASAQVNILVNALPPVPSISASRSLTFCEGDSTVLSTSSLNGNQWLLNSVPIIGATGTIYAAMKNGAYTLINTNNSGCTISSSAINITVNSIPNTPKITSINSNSICIGSVDTLASNVAVGNQWFFNGSPITGATTSQYIASKAGTYTLNFSTNGCSSLMSNEINIIINPIPSEPLITIKGSSTNFCFGDSVIFVSSRSNKNQWYLNGSPITGASDSIYKAKVSGSYSVTNTINGCTSRINSAVFVNVNPKPDVPIISTDSVFTICSGTTVTLKSNSKDNNQWFRDSLLIVGASDNSYVSSISGNYILKVTNSFGCSSVSQPVSVIINFSFKPIISSEGGAAICAGGSITLKSDALTGNQWYKDSVMISGVNTQSFSTSAAGKYYVVVTNSNGCKISSTVFVVTISNYPSIPIITVSGPTSICSGNSVLLTSNSSTGNQWYKDGIAINGALSAIYTVKTAGIYTDTVSNTAGCKTGTVSTTVTVNALPFTPTISSGGPLTFCSGGSVVLTSSSSSGNQWFKDLIAINTATTPTYSATASGSYSVITTNIGGCSTASLPSVVTVTPTPPKPVITRNGTDLLSSGNTGNQWYNDVGSIIGATGASYRPSLSGYYKTQITSNGCTSPMSDSYFYLVTAITNINNTNIGSYRLLPNPVTDQLFIEANNPVNKISIQLLDMKGAVIINKYFTKNVILSLRDISAGIYTVILTDNKTKKQESKQVIKQ